MRLAVFQSLNLRVGYRNGRMLLDELRVLGYVDTYKSVGKVLSPLAVWERRL
jgi:hypothetical protein